MEAKLGLADVHIHTSFSDGMADIPELLEFVERRTNLDVIAVTDHDEIKGSYLARELAAKGKYRYQVIVGMEVTTLDGHLLGLFLERPVRSWQSAAKTVDAIHAQGGLCIVPHPMSWLTRSVSRTILDGICNGCHAGVYFDGIEVFNGTIAGKVGGPKAKELNQRYYKLSEIGNSDAHFLASVGHGRTIFRGRSAEDLRASILSKTTEALAGTPISLNKIGYSQVVRQLGRGLIVVPSRLVGRSVRELWRIYRHENRSGLSL
ncbi:MAG: PHP domain-containing protein [Chloroflexi bacterium]|nr:PHP domain-containing protein [Chloroflexota bacterium]